MAYDEFVKGMAIGMMRCGRSAYKVARELDISRTTVTTWWSRWRREGHLRRRKISEPKNCLSSSEW